MSSGKPNANNFYRCSYCGNVYRGLASVRAHIRLAHPGKDEMKFADAQPPAAAASVPAANAPAEPAPQPAAQAPAAPAPSQADFAAAVAASLQGAMAPMVEKMNQLMALQSRRPPVFDNRPAAERAPAPQPPADLYPKPSAAMSEETGQRICHGLECFERTAKEFRTTAEKLAETVAHRHDEPEAPQKPEKGKPHSDEALRKTEAALDSMIRCPDGVCDKILRRKVMENMDVLFPDLTLRRKDGTDATKPEAPAAVPAPPAQAPPPVQVAAPAAPVSSQKGEPSAQTPPVPPSAPTPGPSAAAGSVAPKPAEPAAPEAPAAPKEDEDAGEDAWLGL